MKIPKYKRDRYTFASNLKEVTADPTVPLTLKRDAYLLSERYATPSSVDKALMVRRRRNLLISDNGNFSRMQRIAKDFQEEGERLVEVAEEEVTQHRRVSATTAALRKTLMQSIGAACAAFLDTLDVQEITSRQIDMHPHYLIGMEDFTIPVMMLCGMMHPVFRPSPEEVAPFQRQTLALFEKQRTGDFGFRDELSEIAGFLVLHAYDYESAFQAARNSLSAPKDGVAISYGAPMASRKWIDRLRLGDETEAFDERLPESYLVAQSLTLGVLNGHPTDVPYHILGVGTPILVALIGYQLRHSRAVSVDSTAPFKDAYAGKLYGSRHAFLKMDMYRVAAQALVTDRPFHSSTPFFRMFEQRFPSNWKGLRDTLRVVPSADVRELAKKLKRRPALLEQYIPFFARARSGNDPLMTTLRIARSGHNYWILRNICRNINAKRESPTVLNAWIERQVGKYVAVASPKWAKAVAKTYELTEKHRALG
jgi:hypothetical protein